MHSYRQIVTRTLVLAALLALPLPALAQATQSTTPSHQGFGIGVKGGPVFSSLSIEGDDVDLDGRTGWTAGLFLGGNRPGVVGVGVDLLFARKGAKDGDVTLTQDYLNVPVYLRINAGSSNINTGVIGYGTVGVDLNFLMKSKFSGGEDVDNTDDFKRADYGLAVGLGIEVSRFILEGRYTKGLGSIAKHDDDPEIKTQAISVMFGVRFN